MKFSLIEFENYIFVLFFLIFTKIFQCSHIGINDLNINELSINERGIHERNINELSINETAQTQSQRYLKYNQHENEDSIHVLNIKTGNSIINNFIGFLLKIQNVLVNNMMEGFDLYGNELIKGQDCEIGPNHFLCKKFGNESEVFRKFGGLLLSEENNHYIEDTNPHPPYSMSRLGGVNFCRIKDLLRNSHKKKSSSSNFNNNLIITEESNNIALQRKLSKESVQFWSNPMNSMNPISAYKLKNSFPNLHKNLKEKSQFVLAELLVVDLLLGAFPNLKDENCSLIESAGDAAGLGLLLFLLHVDDLPGYSILLKEFIKLMSEFGGIEFFSNENSIETLKRSILLEKLFVVSVQSSFIFTLQVFFHFELVNFNDEETLKFILKSTKDHVVIKRFFDYFDLNSLITNENFNFDFELIGDEFRKVPLIHYLLNEYPQYLLILFEESIYQINWFIGEFGEEIGGRSLIWRLLNLKEEISNSFSPNSSSLKHFNKRKLIKEIFSRFGNESIKTHINPNRDLIDEAFEEEFEEKVIKWFAESCLYWEMDDLMISGFMRRILGIWQNEKLLEINEKSINERCYNDNEKCTEIEIINENFRFKEREKGHGIFKFFLLNCKNSNSIELINVLQECFQFLSENLIINSNDNKKFKSSKLKFIHSININLFSSNYKKQSTNPIDNPKNCANLKLMKEMIKRLEIIQVSSGYSDYVEEILSTWRKLCD